MHIQEKSKKTREITSSFKKNMGLPTSSSLFFEEKKFVKLISRKIVHQSMNNIIKIFMVSDYNQNNNSYEDYTYTSFTSNMIFPPNHVTIQCLQIFLCIFKKMIIKKINAGFSKLKKRPQTKSLKMLTTEL